MRTNKQPYQAFKNNIISFGLENAVKILEVDFAFLSNLINDDSIKHDDLRLRYTIKLLDHIKKQVEAAKPLSFWRAINPACGRGETCF